MRKLVGGLLCLLAGEQLALADFAFTFNAPTASWTLNNGLIRSTFRIDENAKFTLVDIDNIQTGQNWHAADGQASSPISCAKPATPRPSSSKRLAR